MFHETTATVSTIWGFAYNAIYKVIKRYLCSVWFYQNGAIYVIIQRPPEDSGSSLQEIVDILYELSAKAGLSALRIWAVEELLLKDYKDLVDYEITSEYSGDWSEYAYKIGDLLELSGGINLNKRNRLKKFLNRQDISLLPINRGNIHTCLAIEDEWCRHQDCKYCKSFSGCAKESLHNMIDIFDDHIHRGILAYIDNTLAGYVIWEQASRIAFVYFSKAIVANYNVYLYYILSKMYLSDAEYVNISSDMGHAGLRLFKQHLGTYELWGKYLCTLTKQGAEI
jgi:hypothetical protein